MKREFIPNVDTANEEIVRLDAEVARVEGEVTKAQEDLKKAQDDLKAAQDLLAGAPKAEDLKKAQDDLKAAQDSNQTLEAKIKELAPKVDNAARASLEAAAAAGVEPAKDVQITGIDNVDEVKQATAGKTGLARAIAANTAMQAAKHGGARS